jgi:hypothetical protein
MLGLSNKFGVKTFGKVEYTQNWISKKVVVEQLCAAKQANFTI